MNHFAQSNHDFLDTCKNLIERMINTVPSNVMLSKPITPITVKPYNLNIIVNATTNTMAVSGQVRVSRPLTKRCAAKAVRLQLLTSDSIQNVLVHYTPRNGEKCGNCTFNTFSSDDTTGGGNFANFTWYLFNGTIPITRGISSFTVEIQDEAKGATIADNAGHGFPMQDAVALDLNRICLSTSGSFTENFVAAVRSGFLLCWRALNILLLHRFAIVQI